MIRTSFIAATLLMLMGTASSFAASTQPLGPSQTGPVVTREQGEIASPGDPFIPERPQRAGSDNTSPFGPAPLSVPNWVLQENLGLTCKTFWWYGINDPAVSFTNTSNEVIPKGTVFTFIIKPGGETVTYEFHYDMEPGESLHFDLLTGVDADQLECVAVVKVKVVAKEPAGDKVP